MALDCQSNWDIQMQDNLVKVLSSARTREPDVDVRIPTKLPVDNTPPPWTTEPIYLPDEIIIQILEYLAIAEQSQQSLGSAALLSHQWYSAAVPFLYARPYLYGKNFDPFIRAICPSINLHVRNSPLSKLVRVLDMGKLVHQGSKSVTARLLGRTKENLEYFRAPQASFAVNCLPALAKCRNLESLDLSLVSESPPLDALLKTVSNLPNLVTFRLPRSSGFGVHVQPSCFTWPPKLEDLALSGGIDAHFLHGIVAFPQTLKKITIEHCPLAKGFAVAHLLRTAVRPLRNLQEVKIAHMPRLSSQALDDILFLLPQIRKLSISVDYITPAMFDDSHFNHFKAPIIVSSPNAAFSTPSEDPTLDVDNAPTPTIRHQHLHTLELTNSGNPNVEDKISPLDIIIALDDDVLPALRVVRVARNLFWHSNTLAPESEALADVLVEASKRDWEARVGAFAPEKMRREVYEKADWARRAGVWQFDG